MGPFSKVVRPSEHNLNFGSDCCQADGHNQVYLIPVGGKSKLRRNAAGNAIRVSMCLNYLTTL